MCGYAVDKTARIENIKIVGIVSLVVGKNSFIGSGTIITGGQSSVEIGSFCDIANNVILGTGTHSIDVFGERSAGKGYSKSIIVRNGAWIGMGAIVLPGVTIGEKAVVGAGSVVTKDVSPCTIVAGNPARKIRDIHDCQNK